MPILKAKAFQMAVHFAIFQSQRLKNGKANRPVNGLNKQTEWHRIVIKNRLGEIAQQYLKKGSKVYIEGKLKTRQWTDQNGIERYTTEIHADQLQMLDSAPQANGY